MIKLIIWIVIALLVLSFFGVSLRTLVLSPTAQDNFAFVWSLVLVGWNWVLGWFASIGNTLNHLMPMGHTSNSASVINALREQ